MKLKRLFSAPVYVDDNQNRLAETLNAFQWFSLVCLTIIGLSLALTGRFDVVIIVFVVSALMGASIWLNHLRRIRWGELVFLLSLLTGATIQMQRSNGVHDITLLSYMAILVLAGLLLDLRGFVAFTFIMFACLAWLIYGETHGFFQTPYTAMTDPADFFLIGVILVMTAIAVRWIADLVQESAQAAQRKVFELQQTQEALRLSEEKFSKAFHMTPFTLCLNRVEDGEFIEINQGFTNMSGYTPDEVAGKTSLELNIWVNPQDRARLVEGLKAHGEVKDLETCLRRKSGEIDVCLMSAVIIDIHGEKCLLSLARDITEFKRAEAEIHRLNIELEQRVKERTAQLEAANKELESFAYSVSHDLRAPLRAIAGFSKIVVEEYHHHMLDEIGVERLNRIMASAIRMDELINDLLKFSRLSRQPLNKEDVNSHALVAQIVAEINAACPDRSIEWQIHDLADCQADISLLRQVYINLIDNAVKYTRGREPAHIEVGSRQEDGKRIFFVRDNGAGFDMRYADKLFGVFQRLHSESEFEGTGIGLATTQRIIARHGGRVWAEAEVDRGATFYFTLG